MGYVMIENHLSAPQSCGWKSAVESARDAPHSAFFAREQHLTSAPTLAAASSS
jgi:hypothetical protein